MLLDELSGGDGDDGDENDGYDEGDFDRSPQTRVVSIEAGARAFKTMEEDFEVGYVTIPRFVAAGTGRSVNAFIGPSEFLYEFEWPDLRRLSGKPVEIYSWYGGGESTILPPGQPAIVLNNQYGYVETSEDAELKVGMECVITVPCKIVDKYVFQYGQAGNIFKNANGDIVTLEE